MKIQFLKTYRDPYDPNRYYQPGWVAEFTDADAERAIEAGFAKPAPVDAFSRKYAAPELVSSECVPTAGPLSGDFNRTGEEIDFGGLISGKTYSIEQIQKAEEKRGKPFPEAKNTNK